MWFTLAIKTYLKTCLPRVNLRQVTLQRDYIHNNKQPVVFMPHRLSMLCPFAANWWLNIYCACSETSIGTFITPEKCKRYTASLWPGMSAWSQLPVGTNQSKRDDEWFSNGRPRLTTTNSVRLFQVLQIKLTCSGSDRTMWTFGDSPYFVHASPNRRKGNNL